MRNVNWEALTAIAELVGAAGVVVSLIYVASEINQNTRQVEEATRVERLAQLDATFEQFSKQRMLFATEPAAVRILLTGMEDPDALSPVEQFQFENMLGEFLHASQLLFARAEEGVMYEEVWDNLLFGLEPFVRSAPR